jgi:cyclic beta-1,2-glucan synthetase
MSLLALDNTLAANIMQRRFHADLRIRAVESLLFERIPLSPPALNPGRSSPALLKPVPEEEPGVTLNEETSTPRVFLRSNGSYSFMVSTSGGGYSRYNGIDLTRWSAHPAEDKGGTCIYLRDLRSGGVGPPTAMLGEARWKSLRSLWYGQGRVRAARSGIETLMEVTVARAT